MLTQTINKILEYSPIKRRFFIKPTSATTQNISICFAITVFDEHEELCNLLDGILPFIKENDEILIQGDEGKVTSEVLSVIEKYQNSISKYIEYPLNNNFGKYKNNLAKNTNCNYIFQLDADEIPSPILMRNIHSIIENNLCDLIRVARINILIENEEPFVLWNSFDKKNFTNYIDFPNYQKRIYRNTPKIQWEKALHEKIIGFKSTTYLPTDENYCILHCKHLKKQKTREVIFAECKN